MRPGRYRAKARISTKQHTRALGLLEVPRLLLGSRHLGHHERNTDGQHEVIAYFPYMLKAAFGRGRLRAARFARRARRPTPATRWHPETAQALRPSYETGLSQQRAPRGEGTRGAPSRSFSRRPRRR